MQPDPENFIQTRTKRFFRLMPKGSDLTLIILKGHLLVEEELNDFLSRYPIHPPAFNDARLTFFQKLRVVRAFSILPCDAAGWKLAEGLNKLRNTISHQTEVSDLPSLVDAFLAIQERHHSKKKTDSHASRAARLKGTIAFAAGYLSALTEVMLVTKRFPLERDTKV